MRASDHSSLLLHNVTEYLSITKPAIALLNVFVGLATMLLAVNVNLGVAGPLFLLCAAGFLAAGGAGALNCYVESDLDSGMQRTQHRPLPSHRISDRLALSIGVGFSVCGVVLAALYLNLLTAFMIGLGVFWYVIVYTLWLKPRTKWNIVIGGAAGSFAALAGWSAATGSFSLVAFFVAFLIFLWTPGHFWGLAIAKVDEYTTIRVPMLPVVDGVKRSSIYTAASNIALLPFTLGLFALTANPGNVIVLVTFAAALILYNLRFVIVNLRMVKNPTPRSAWRVFKMSISYLFVVLLLVVAAHLV